MVQVPLKDYGYANARVRAKTARLLDAAAYGSLIEAKDEDEILNLLEQTDYAPEIEEAILEGKRPTIIDRAFNRNLARNFSHFREFVSGPPYELLSAVLSRWDLYNLKSILRGKRGLVPASEISRVMVPAGDLDLVTLEEIASQPDLRSAIDLIVTFSSNWTIPYGRALARKMGEYLREHDLSLLERSLDTFHYDRVHERIKGSGINAELVGRMVQMEVDIINIVTILRTRGLEMPSNRVPEYFLPGGNLDEKQFKSMMELKEREDVVRASVLSAYRQPLVAGMGRYEEKGDVAFQDELDRYLIRKCLGMNQDPLSIGVIIAYMWRKYMELVNLRVIIRGKNIGLIGSQIKKEMIVLEAAGV